MAASGGQRPSVGMLILSGVAGLMWIGGIMGLLRLAFLPAWMTEKTVAMALIVAGLLLEAATLVPILGRKARR